MIQWLLNKVRSNEISNIILKNCKELQAVAILGKQ